jgi:cytochrome c-type biogenesis protein
MFASIISGNFAFAFGAGMLATVNPCGFVLLPTYLSYFLGVEGARPGSQRSSIARALVVSAAVSLGFFSVFLVIGLITRWGFTWIRDSASGWLSLVIGALMLIFGVVTLFGIHLPVLTPKLDAGGRGRSLRSMFVYGIAYAVASIGCTLPVFAGSVLGQVNAAGFVGGVLSVATYGLGMGLVLSALTVSLALARSGLLVMLRRAMARIDLFSGAILILAGVYLLLYGWVAIDPIHHDVGVVNTVENWQGSVQTWVNNHRGLLGWLAGLVTVVAIAATRLGRRRRGDEAAQQPDPQPIG